MKEQTRDVHGRKSNRLLMEKSPYLQQHAHNPVDWFPWGEEAFAKARTEDKPIFLSIGYSSCHWCHVMERESFEDEDVARLLNANFVCIKVDREERPDVDQIYMRAVQAMTGSGGWPLNVFLTPKLKPFYGGTYFPPVSRYGMPGFSSLIRNISDAWKRDRKQLLDSASEISKAISQTPQKGDSQIDELVFDKCFSELALYFDESYGGFGSSPKFPTPSNLYFLLRYHLRSKSRAPLNMVTKTLDEMAMGGIYDQLGGGFHRYSTDRMWLVPHFEKMLYDNALLAIAYLEAFLVTKDEEYLRIVKETLNWVLSEMTSNETGGYYSAQDADSPEGEGEYYIWTQEQIRDLLRGNDGSGDDITWSEQQVNAILVYFGVSDKGNFESGKNILTARINLRALSSETKIPESELLLLIGKAKKILLEARSARPKPLTDDKILTGWNGMMISAMSKAYQVSEDQRFLTSGKRAADFILATLASQSENGRITLRRRYRDGEVKDDGVLEDYAYFGNSLIDLYEATFDSRYLRSAISICESMLSLFFDQKDGGFFDTRVGAKDLILRTKESYDGAVPSSNSMAVLFSLRIGEILSDETYKEDARRTIEAFWSSIESNPSSHTEMLVALAYLSSRPKEIVVAGDLALSSTQELVRELRLRFLPSAVVIYADKELESELPLVEGRVSKPGQRPRVYVCTGFQCKLPSETLSELAAALTD